MSRRQPDPGQARLEGALRHALHTAVDSIEPQDGGMDRIRSKIAERGAAGQPAPGRFWTAWRRDGQTGGVRWRTLQPAGAWLAYAFGAVVERFRPEPGKTGWLGWLRPAAAVGTGIFVLAAAGLAVAALPHALSPSGGGQSPHPSPARTAHSHSPATGSGGATSNPYGNSSPASTSTCSPSSYPGGGVPTITPSTSPSPSPTSTSPSTSPASSPSPSGSVTSTPQPSDSAASDGTDQTASAADVALVSPGPTVQISQPAATGTNPAPTGTPTSATTPGTSGSPGPCGGSTPTLFPSP